MKKKIIYFTFTLLLVTNINARPLRKYGQPVKPSIENVVSKDNIKPLLFITGTFLTLAFFGQQYQTDRIIKDVSNSVSRVMSSELQKLASN